MKAITDFLGAVFMLALTIAFGFLLGWSFNQWNNQLPAQPPAGCVIMEDGSANCTAGSFQWDCSTMGNQVCGKP